MPQSSVPGRSIVTRRALLDIVRAAVVGSYGVIGLADPDPIRRALRAFGVPPRGIALSLRDGIGIDVHVTVAHGLPIAEVARQVDSAIRYAIRHAVGTEVARLVVHVNGLRVLPAASQARPDAAGPDAATGLGVGHEARPDQSQPAPGAARPHAAPRSRAGGGRE